VRGLEGALAAMLFHASKRLYQACRVTLFTRENCSLCTDAKTVLSKVWDSKPFVYREIDVMQMHQKSWRDLYEFDTPVIHISKADQGDEVPEMSGKATKLMHRFKAEQIIERMDELET